MDFIKKIREELGFTHYRMAQEMGISHVYSYTRFEEAREALNADKLVKLWKLSGISGNEFMSMIEKEVTRNKGKRK